VEAMDDNDRGRPTLPPQALEKKLTFSGDYNEDSMENRLTVDLDRKPMRKQSGLAARLRKIESMGDYIEIIAGTGSGKWARWCTFVLAFLTAANSMQGAVTLYCISCRDLSFPDAYLSPKAVPAATFAGNIIGYLMVMPLANSFGRKRVLLYVTSVEAVVICLTALSPTFEFLVFMRFLASICSAPQVLALQLLLEVVESERRGALGNLAINVFGGIGGVATNVLAWLIVPQYGWRFLLIATAVPYVINVGLLFTISESPRWLLSQGRVKDAKDSLDYMANFNNTTLGDGPLQVQPTLEQAPLLGIGTGSVSCFASMKRVLLDVQMLFGEGKLLLMFYLICAWACLKFAYSSVVLYDFAKLGAYPGECNFDYSFEILIATSEVPFGLLAMPFMDRADLSPWIGGRVGTTFSACVFGIIALCLASYTVSPVILWAYCARGLLHNVSGIMTVQATEVFDVSLRATGLGLLSFVGLCSAYGGIFWVFGPVQSETTIGLGIAAMTFFGMLAAFEIPETAQDDLDMVKYADHVSTPMAKISSSASRVFGSFKSASDFDRFRSSSYDAHEGPFARQFSPGARFGSVRSWSAWSGDLQVYQEVDEEDGG